jgi:hypothetical protein
MIRIKSFLPATLFLILIACKPARFMNVKDGFESDSLSNIWTDDKFLPGALSFQSKYVRSGNKAALLILYPGDQIDEEKGTILERAELKETKKLVSTENSIYEYSFSILLPPDFPLVATRLVIAQWKQDCQSGDCKPDNPVIALRYVSGKFFITLQTEPKPITLFTREDSILNQWLDFKFRIRFSRMQDGAIKAWLNGNQIIDYKGITAYSQDYGYPIPGKFYFKMGLYRDHMDQAMTIYIDDYAKKQIPDL